MGRIASTHHATPSCWRLSLALAIAGCANKKTPNSAADLGLGGAGAATPGSAQDFTVNVGDRIFFDTDSSSIRADAQATLARQAQWLNKYAQLRDHRRRPCRRARHARIQPGARRPPRRRHPRLPRLRAASPRNRMKTISYGKERPVAVCDDISCWSQNRRAVTVLNGRRQLRPVGVTVEREKAAVAAAFSFRAGTATKFGRSLGLPVEAPRVSRLHSSQSERLMKFRYHPERHRRACCCCGRRRRHASAMRSRASEVAARHHHAAAQGLARRRQPPPGRPRAERLAQAGDPRVTALEEQIRQLNGTSRSSTSRSCRCRSRCGRCRKTTSSASRNSSGKRSEAGGQAQAFVGLPPASKPSAGGDRARPPTASRWSGAASDSGRSSSPGSVGGVARPAPARRGSVADAEEFGTITFDQNGNVTGGSVGDQAHDAAAPRRRRCRAGRPAGARRRQHGGRRAAGDRRSGGALPQLLRVHPVGRLRHGGSRVPRPYRALSGGREGAPTRISGSAKRCSGRRNTATPPKTFLAANKDYPKSKKAPEMLLKLGVSLVGLNQRDVACATFCEIGKRYPETSAALKERVKQEQALAGVLTPRP